MTMQFFEVPLIGSASLASLMSHGIEIARGIDFQTGINYTLYAGCTGAQTYLARSRTPLNVCYALSLYGNATGHYALVGTPSSGLQSMPVMATSQENVYASTNGFNSPLGGWIVDFDVFGTYDEMVQAFQEQYGNPDTDIVVVAVSATINDNAGEGGGTSGPDSGLNPDDPGSTAYDDTSMPAPLSPLPSLSVLSTGMVSLFCPTSEQLQQLASYLWTTAGDIPENLNKWLRNPMDYLIALNIFPILPPLAGGATAIKIGSFTTEILMPKVQNQWVNWACGNIAIPEYWGSYLDYSPYTKIHAFLPFIGAVQLNTDEVMGRVVSLNYRIDLLSGQCIAIISVNDGTASSVYYQFSGDCAVNVPLTGSDWSRVYSAATGAITAIAGGVASGIVAGAGIASGNAAMSLASNASQVLSANRMIRAAQAAKTAGIINAGAGVVSSVMGAKAYVAHSSSLPSSAGLIGMRLPYVMLEYPNQSLASDYKHFVGYPSNIQMSLGACSGFTVCEQVIASAPSECSETELEEIITYLKSGVYL